VLFASTALVLTSLGLFLLAVSALCLATFAWWDPTRRQQTNYAPVRSDNTLTFSLIMPCREEPENVMRATLDQLLGQTHPDLEVIISVGDDDHATVAIAHQLAQEYGEQVLVSVDYSPVKNKPRQLNTALKLCSGDIVGVFDAESIAAPELLRHIDTSFVVHNADVVQGAVQLVNFRDSWYSLRNCLEYFVWFSSRLHAQARMGFVPLGGNTVFIRRKLINAIGGWDPDCLAEDCDLGVRLSSKKHRMVVAYAPDLVTREETPTSVRAMVKQRTRWSLGFMQVYAKGDWRQLPTVRDKLIAWWTLTQQHAMAATGLLVPISIVLAIFAKFPLPVTLFTFLPLMAMVVMLAFECCMLFEFGREHGYKIRLLDYVRLVVGAPAYQMIMSFAALRAMVKFSSKDFRWEKTAHTGTHHAYLEAS
jgi:glycosyltransferase XagB